MSEFKHYRRKSVSEMRPYIKGELLGNNVSISDADRKNGSPKVGDMIARNPKNHVDKWLVSMEYFIENLELINQKTPHQERMVTEESELNEKIMNCPECKAKMKENKKLSRYIWECLNCLQRYFILKTSTIKPQ